MKIHYQNLLDFLNKKPSIKDISEKLFQLGHEHEIHEEIFDFELTPNRGDCLSISGLARDLNIFYGYSNKIEVYDGDIEELDIDFENHSPKDCPSITFMEIEIGNNVSTYKPYLENFYNLLDNKKTNFFTDISNYISYELGQPTHCFDREKINNKIIFENKHCDLIFETLIGSKIELAGENCVFSSEDQVISLAGIMGGASSACSSNTKKVLIECAYFRPESIIGKSTKYNLNSDAAHKFERGVDSMCHEYVLRRFARIVEDHASIHSLKIKRFLSLNAEQVEIPIDSEKINDILGTNIGKTEYIETLRDLGFSINEKIIVPSYRNDIETQNDLAEEIARVIGYDNIPSMPVTINDPSKNYDDKRVKKIKCFLKENGFNEVINFPFTSSNIENSVLIDNPLDVTRKYLRTSLKESLTENHLYNERRQKDAIKLFEISDIYTNDSVNKQQKRLGIIISGRLGLNYEDFSRKLDKEYLENLFDLELNNNAISVIEMDRATLDTKKKDKIFYAEIIIDNIHKDFLKKFMPKKEHLNFNKYEPISDYPCSKRDLSFSITDLSKVSFVIEYFEKINDEILNKVFIFDFFKNSKSNSVKLGYRFIFQSKSKTLSDEEVNKKIHEFINPILKLEGITIPGM